MIDWARSQAALTRAGYPCGRADGQPGLLTWTALVAYAAGRPADAAVSAIGAEAIRSLGPDPIAAEPDRLAEFLAQTAHETGGYRAFEERLGYSATQLRRQWPNRFTAAQAVAAAGHPREVASRAYGGRMGNAAYPSLDGWTYRGRGMLQLTGRDNYARFGRLTGLPLLAQPDLAADPADSLRIAIAFWADAGVNDCIDCGDFRGARKLTNGGFIGFDDVALRRAVLLRVLQ